MKEVFCQRCQRMIERGEKSVSLNTCQEHPKISDERWFHWVCYNEWLDECVAKKAMKVFNNSMKQIMPVIKPMAEGIANSFINAKEETNQIYEVGTS